MSQYDIELTYLLSAGISRANEGVYDIPYIRHNCRLSYGSYSLAAVQVLFVTFRLKPEIFLNLALTGNKDAKTAILEPKSAAINFPKKSTVYWYFQIWTQRQEYGSTLLEKVLKKSGQTRAMENWKERKDLVLHFGCPKRWVVEESFAWLEKCYRLWKN